MSFSSLDSAFSIPFLRDDADSEHAPQLERDYCSNFVCCGLALADLHELVSHFEETHVTVVSPSGAPLPPDSPTDVASPQTASSSALESPRSACATPSPPPNLFPTLTAAFRPRESAFEPVTTSPSRDPCAYGDAWEAPLHLAKEEQYVFDTMLRSEAYDCNAPGGLHDVRALRLPPAQLSPLRYPSSAMPDQTSGYANHTGPGSAYALPPTLAPTPVYARPPMLSILTEAQASVQAQQMKKRNVDGISCVSAGDAITPRRKKGALHKPPIREKTHKCPHAGCIKSYMNPNGLKYHLTKGACDFGLDGGE